MSDEFSKRHLDETERLARLADPLREFKALQTPVFRTQEQLAALFRNPLEDFRAQVKALTDPFGRVADQLKAAYGQDAIAEQVKALLEPFSGAQAWIKAFRSEEEERRRQWSMLFDDIARQLRDLPDEARGQLTVLMDQGWCLDPEMPHSWGRDLVAAFREGEKEEAQQWLIDYFMERLEGIEQALVERHPKRSAIIVDAFQAHRQGRYHLSIPVLLAQADGVIHDRHQRQLFSKKRTANLMEVLSNLPDDDMRAIFMAAFYVDIPLTRNIKLLPDDFDGLNRHAVLHGTDPNYGTEINSLRAVSILNLASYLVSEEIDPK